jgi:hypothetical protein
MQMPSARKCPGPQRSHDSGPLQTVHSPSQVEQAVSLVPPQAAV